jgi:hypothetical protein
MNRHRRRWLRSACVLAAAGAAALRPVRAGPEPDPDAAAALAGALESAPADDIARVIAGAIDSGHPPVAAIVAIQTAASRTVAPRPSVGYKYHAAMMAQALHLAALALPERERWLPVFWGAAYLKQAQARDAAQGDWTLSPAPTRVAADAGDAFRRAMDAWDAEAADAAIAALALERPSAALIERLFLYGARDFRDIGHKAIATANCHRLLELDHWRSRAPLLRSLVFALQNHHGEANPAGADLAADRSWRLNLTLAASIRDDWQSGRDDHGATRTLVAGLREGSPETVGREVLAQVNAGVAPQAIWDAVHLGAAELMLRRPGIVALHAHTAGNALHYAWRVCRGDRARRMLLLQAAAFIPQFRDAMAAPVREETILAFEPAGETEGPDALAATFEVLADDRLRAARLLLGHLETGGDAAPILDAARRYTVTKTTGVHDYKFTEALIENAAWLSPRWRARYLASGAFWFNGPGDRDNPVVEQARALLARRQRLRAASDRR